MHIGAEMMHVKSITTNNNNNRLSANISIQGQCGNRYGSLLGGRDVNSYINTCMLNIDYPLSGFFSVVDFCSGTTKASIRSSGLA